MAHLSNPRKWESKRVVCASIELLEHVYRYRYIYSSTFVEIH